jgi:hypothetical protein
MLQDWRRCQACCRAQNARSASSVHMVAAVRLQAAAHGFLTRLTAQALRDSRVCCGGLVDSSSRSPDQGVQWEAAKPPVETLILIHPCSQGISYLPPQAVQGMAQSSAPWTGLAAAGSSSTLRLGVGLWWAALGARKKQGGLVGFL